jgi:hypothetical protein
MSPELFELRCSLVTISERAMLVKPRDSLACVWIPKSHIEKFELNPSSYDSLWITAWMAKQLGLR